MYANPFSPALADGARPRLSSTLVTGMDGTAMMKDRLAQRLKAVRERLGFTQQQMASAVGTKHRSWQDYETGRSIPGGRVLAGLAELDVDINWLLTGRKGQFSLQTLSETLEQILAELEPQLSRDEKQILCSAFDELKQRLMRE